MKSRTPKVLHEAGGAPLIDWVVHAMRDAGIDSIVAVVSADAAAVRDCLGESVRYAVQKERRGSGHAAQIAMPEIPDGSAYTFIAAGDMPLLTAETIRLMIEKCETDSYDCMLLSAVVQDPAGYGRIIRAEDGSVEAIVEHRDASDSQRAINEVNASCYCVRTELLRKMLPGLSCDNAQGEYYLTDIVKMMRERGYKIGAFLASEEECLGVNDRVQLYEASRRLYMRTARRHMMNGVTVVDASSAYIDPETVIGQDTVVYPGVVLENGCRIGSDVVMYPGSRISSSVIGDGTQVQNSVVLDSEIGRCCTIGPYAYIRPGTRVGDDCRVGDFVEIKNSTIGDGTKISHLTYIGDADFGEGINVGCGTIVVNYDGRDKFRSSVGDRAFIGCNSNLISPVNVGEGAYIAAGSTITSDVPPDVLAIARARQTVVDNWKDKRRSGDEN